MLRGFHCHDVPSFRECESGVIVKLASRPFARGLRLMTVVCQENPPAERNGAILPPS
jgi:hypothetical protein